MKSKLYKTYIQLKVQDSRKKYLFKSGIFYYFLADDAKELHEILNLKLVPLNSVIVKCGFPINSLNKYMHILKSKNYFVEIVDTSSCTLFNYQNYMLNENIIGFFKNISSLKVDSLSISQCYRILESLQQESIKILGKLDEKKR